LFLPFWWHIRTKRNLFPAFFVPRFNFIYHKKTA